MKQSNLDRYVSIISDFSKFPEEEYTKEILFNFKGKEVYVWNIGNMACMKGAGELDVYLNVSYNVIKHRFNDYRNEFHQGKDYLWVDLIKVQIVPLIKRGRGRLKGNVKLFFTLSGVLKLLRHIRKGLTAEFYNKFTDLLGDAVNNRMLRDGSIRLQIVADTTIAHKAVRKVSSENLKILHDKDKFSPPQLKAYNEIIRQEPELWNNVTLEKWITTDNKKKYCRDIDINGYPIEIDGKWHGTAEQMVNDRIKDMDIQEKKGTRPDRIPTELLGEKKDVIFQVARLLKRYNMWKDKNALQE